MGLGLSSNAASTTDTGDLKKWQWIQETLRKINASVSYSVQEKQ
jgi:hypothetical protein